MADNIVNLRPVSLNDIPGMLRQLADRFESGEETSESLLVLIPPTEDDDTFWPKLLQFGENWETHYRIAQLELARQWVINDLTAR